MKNPNVPTQFPNEIRKAFIGTEPNPAPKPKPKSTPKVVHG